MSDDTVREVGRFEYWCLRTLEGVRDGCTWMTQKFASWFATAWLYLILWSVVLGAFLVLLYIDGKFSRGLAEGVEDINPLSFQAMGWVYRLFAVAFLMAGARCVHKGIKGAKTFRWLGVFASIVVCLHAFGFGFEALDHRRDQAMAARAVVEVSSVSYTDQIDLLREQKGDIDAETTLAVTALTAEIQQYITDGLNNDDLADDSRERRTQLQDDARGRKAGIDAEIMRLTAESAASSREAIEVQSEAEPWAPLFVGMAQLFTWEKEPDDWSIYLCAIGFVILWVLLGESLVIFVPERIYMMHLRDAQLADDKPKKTIRLKDGQSAMLFDSQAERDEYEDLLTRGRNSKAGVEKRESTIRRRDKRIEALDYYSEKITEALDRATRLKWKPQGIADSVFNMSLGEMIHMLEQQLDMGRISQADYDLITGGQIVNGKDKFTDDEGGASHDEHQP